MMMQTGQAAPWFTAPTPSVPNFNFSSLGGRYVLLAFLPTEPIARQLALAAMQAHQSLYDQTNLVAFGVLRDPVAMSQAQDRPGLMWFLDQSGAVSRAYGAVSQAGVETPYWCLLDPSLRVMVAGGMDQTEQVFAAIRALPAPGDHAGVPLHAPVLVVPRIFEPEMCARLIEFYERRGGERSGTMRQVGGKTVAVLDDFKSRRDATIEDEAFRDELRARIQTRLLRPINRAFQFNPTRIERYIVACYDADDGGGYFKPHRDNTTSGTAHRKFACSINLNAEEFEGGDLRFPEFGPKTYRPPTGGAVVFSCSLLHEATPVTRGRRYAFLPFFFDEAGEALRQKNLHTLQFGDEPSARAAGA
ncbi:putative 2-oxoglutarate/Fe(II)-dependent dioxygenase YbiX/peroxiredoxin [Phenylobacterium haematophilum]|uniref:Putative 2-oxoglutarate/Fe(II)-dependent dioxygenase YbiX/peroxiredoxin n=2 Tax=Phenylobacterium haematophilum TaxID=98513 RepID=A0A839ZZ66_9CAUL|nr:putative 2-oxoglutarate/Fe(II)-dependent dioxygenase YbiX/peroxiredoxin [Phenylobacterium haematophilum]